MNFPLLIKRIIREGGIFLDELVQAISTVGFPIIAFLLVFWKFDKSLSLLTEAVNNNTRAVQLLLQKEELNNPKSTN